MELALSNIGYCKRSICAKVGKKNERIRKCEKGMS